MKPFNLEEIKKCNNVDILEEQFHLYLTAFSCRPDREDFPYPKIGSTLDEEKSVRWNREEVDRLRAVYNDEVKKLQKLHNEINKAYENRMTVLLAKEYKLSKEQASLEA